LRRFRILIEDIGLMEYWNQPEAVVSIIKEFKGGCRQAGSTAECRHASSQGCRHNVIQLRERRLPVAI